jgi:uncharacterized protein YbjT (DUF2867 family)
LIAVIGGSGLLGRQVVTELVDRGERVRVLVREAERARSLLSSEVEVLTHDVRRSAGLAEALAGASVIIFAAHGFLGGRGNGPIEVDRRGTGSVLKIAAATGAHVVLVSALGAAADSKLDLFRAKYAAEQQLRAAGRGWTIIRPGPFLETWLKILAETAEKSGRPLIFGRGNRPIGFVAAADIAALVVRAATDVKLRGQLIEVAGTPITMTELASAVQAARGRHGTFRHVPRPMLRLLAVLAQPIDPAFARKNRAALLLDTAPIGTSSDLIGLLGEAG